jgi:signal peptidase I
MNWDLATLLVLLVGVSTLIWLYDKLFLERKRAAAQANASKNAAGLDPSETVRVPLIVDLARSFLPVFLIVLLLRSFLVEPFRIPSGSMMPTLLIGDFILVNKFSYGFRLPVLNTKVIAMGKPERGDVVVFRYPEDTAVPFIKRVVAIPGDHILYHSANKTIYINGEPMPQEHIGTYQGVGSGSNMTGAEQRVEKLSEIQHEILVLPGRLSPGPYQEMIVPPDEYFVLGDNRDNSRDSRFWGTVHDEHLIGKAFFIWMNWDSANGGISWPRLGMRIE